MARGKGGRGGRAVIRAQNLEIQALERTWRYKKSVAFIKEVSSNIEDAVTRALTDKSCAGRVQGLGAASYQIGVLYEGMSEVGSRSDSWELRKAMDSIRDAGKSVSEACSIRNPFGK